MVYKWKENSRIKCDAQVAGEFLEHIDKTVGLTAKNVLEASRSESSPLHDDFEWDDTVAAEEYRKKQASHIICCIETVIKTNKNEDVQTRAFCIVKEEDTKVFKPIVSILKNKDTTEQLYQCACRELKIFRKKYESIEKLSNIFHLIDSEIE